MAGSKGKWASAAAIALVMTMLAGEALAYTATRPSLGPLGGPMRWPQIIRMQLAAGVTLVGPGGGLLTLRGRAIGAYGKVGWGGYRLVSPGH